MFDEIYWRVERSVHMVVRMELSGLCLRAELGEGVCSEIGSGPSVFLSLCLLGLAASS